MRIYVENGKIYFNSDKVNRLGYTDFDEELWDKVNSVKWHVKFSGKNKEKEYINSSKLGLLHRVVMEHWYGNEAIREANERNLVVDHLNNDGLDCRISNLCFIPKARNTAKGMTYDIQREQMISEIALNIFKDFNTQKFQITIGFNKETFLYVNGEKENIACMYLLYENDFYNVFNDAERILHEYGSKRVVNLQKLSFEKFEYEPAIEVVLNPEESNSPMILIDGKWVLNLNSDKIRLNEISVRKELYD